MSQDLQVSNSIWQAQPPLLRLTTIAHGDVDGGVPTPCYIAPQWITSIERKVVSFSKFGTEGEHWPSQCCTYVAVSPSMGYWVVEAPEVVAMMRDRALGHEPKLGAV